MWNIFLAWKILKTIKIPCRATTSGISTTNTSQLDHRRKLKGKICTNIKKSPDTKQYFSIYLVHDVHILWESYFTFQVICLLFIIFVDKIFCYNVKIKILSTIVMLMKLKMSKIYRDFFFNFLFWPSFVLSCVKTLNGI